MDNKKGKGAGDKLKTLKKYIQEKNIIQGLRYLILALLAALCCVIAFASVERGNGAPVIITLASAVALVFSMVMKIFVMRTFMRKINRIVAMSFCEPRSWFQVLLPKTAWPPTYGTNYGDPGGAEERLCPGGSEVGS